LCGICIGYRRDSIKLFLFFPSDSISSMKFLGTFFYFFTLAVVILAETKVWNNNNPPCGKKVLAILDSFSTRHTHSIFFSFLEDKGYDVNYVVASDRSVVFSKYGEWQYDHLIIFASIAEELAGISTETIIEFIDEGHNVFLATDSKLSEAIRDIASECNIEFDEEGSFVIDHIHFNESDNSGLHTLIVSNHIIPNIPIITGKATSKTSPLLFRGIGQDIEEDSQLLLSILRAPSTSYSHDPEETLKNLHVSGKKISLVSALQARNNARAIFAGSLEMFSDRFFHSPVREYGSEKISSFEKSGNELFAKELLQWAFQERGILRARDIRHHRVGEQEAPATYTIKDNVEYSVIIEEWRDNKWMPFLVEDIQMEFIMLDPYIRTTLKHDSNGLYRTSFILPDVYGVFTFKIDYVRPGYGFLSTITRTPVRPFRHNEYERFIPSAYPYYAGAFSMMAGIFIFSWFFLYNREK